MYDGGMGERIEIDIERAAELLGQAVRTQGPDFVYAPNGEECHYVPVLRDRTDDPRSKTGCLIGVALKIAGVDTEGMKAAGSISSLEGQQERYGFRLTIEAARYFAIAQYTQDRGGSWGLAKVAAEAYRYSLAWDEDRW